MGIMMRHPYQRNPQLIGQFFTVTGTVIIRMQIHGDGVRAYRRLFQHLR